MQNRQQSSNPWCVMQPLVQFRLKRGRNWGQALEGERTPSARSFMTDVVKNRRPVPDLLSALSFGVDRSRCSMAAKVACSTLPTEARTLVSLLLTSSQLASL